MLPTGGITIPYVVEVLKRRFWLFIIPFFFVNFATVIYCFRAPNIYESSTLVLVEPQEVPTDYVKSTVTTDATSRLNTLKDQVLSRPNLQTIIEDNDLYAELRAIRPMSEAVESMRKNISVDIKKPSQGNEPASFKVAFKGKEPGNVQKVATQIANLFIQDDLKMRERQASGTAVFLDHELERMRGELRRTEELVRKFKEDNLGMLPEQMENNYRILSQMQQNLDTLNTALQAAEDRRVLLQGQLNIIETQTSQNGVDVRLQALKLELEDLKGRYSENHPYVKRVKNKIANLSAKAKTIRGSMDSYKSGLSPVSETKQTPLMAQKEDLAMQIQLVSKQIEGLLQEKNNTSHLIRKYRQRIEKGPQIEQMFLDLRRDHEEASENYKALLKKGLNAEIAENLERAKKGEQFRILEPANLPHKPSGLNVFQLLAIGFGAALVVSWGTIYLREYTDNTFWTSDEVENFVELPILVNVPKIRTPSQERSHKIRLASSAAVVACMGIVLVYAVYLLMKKTPMWLSVPGLG